MKRQILLALCAVMLATGLSISCTGAATATNPTDDSSTGTDGTATTSGSTTKSADATLASLTVKAGTATIELSPAFAAGTTDYTAGVASTVTSVTVAATATSKAATISGTGDKAISTGANAIAVTVTAEDGTTKTYTVTVTKLTEDSDATLASLSVTEGTNAVSLTPTFSATTTSYTAYVATTITSVNVAATTTVTGASVSGTGDVTLNEGSNTVTLTVTAKDGTTKQTYTLNVIREKLYSISGTITFPSGSVIPTGNILSVGAQKPEGGNWLQDMSVTLTSATSYNYTITGLPAGTYKMTAYTHVSDSDWAVYSYSTCYNWDVTTVISDSDITGKDFTLTVPARAINITAPTITSSTFTVSGTWTGTTAPEGIVASFGGTSPVIATVTGGTWTAEIDASALANGLKQLKVTGGWKDGDDTSLVSKADTYDFTYGVTGYTVSGTITLPEGYSGHVNIFAYADGANPDTTSNATNYDVIMNGGTTCSYTLSGFAPGTKYVIGAYTHSGDWAYVSGTSYYNWTGASVTVSGNATNADFTLSK